MTSDAASQDSVHSLMRHHGEYKHLSSNFLRLPLDSCIGAANGKNRGSARIRQSLVSYVTCNTYKLLASDVLHPYFSAHRTKHEGMMRASVKHRRSHWHESDKQLYMTCWKVGRKEVQGGFCVTNKEYDKWPAIYAYFMTCRWHREQQQRQTTSFTNKKNPTHDSILMFTQI